MKILLIITILFVIILYFKNNILAEKFTLDNSTIIIDVRSNEEYQDGHVDKAINIPHNEIENEINKYVKAKDKKILLYCHSGMRSGIAKNILNKMGYTNVINGGSYKKVKKCLKNK